MKDFYPEGILFGTEENNKYISSESGLLTAQSLECIVEAKVVMCDEAHNLIVDFGFMKGFVPREEGAIGIKEGTVRDIALISRVGRPICFMVKDFETDENGNKYAILSRREAQEKCLNNFLATKIPGDIVDACITHLESFGAFCDIGCGNVALLPIDSISVSRITHPKDRFVPGDKIKAAVKSIDSDNKINLTHKELLGTWKQNAARFSPGQTVSGVVRSVEKYGIFIELTPNLAGLAEPKEGVTVGQSVSVYIKSMIPEKMKVKLVIINNFDSEGRYGYEYYYNQDHIDEFIYSPEESIKTIATFFN